MKSSSASSWWDCAMCRCSLAEGFFLGVCSRKGESPSEGQTGRKAVHRTDVRRHLSLNLNSTSRLHRLNETQDSTFGDKRLQHAPRCSGLLTGTTTRYADVAIARREARDAHHTGTFHHNLSRLLRASTKRRSIQDSPQTRQAQCRAKLYLKAPAKKNKRKRRSKTPCVAKTRHPLKRQAMPKRTMQSRRAQTLRPRKKRSGRRTGL